MEIRGLKPRSVLLLILLLLDLLLRFRISTGSIAGRPLALAKRINMSVRETTPTRCPLIRAPESALAETEGPDGIMKGVLVDRLVG